MIYDRLEPGDSCLTSPPIPARRETDLNLEPGADPEPPSFVLAVRNVSLPLSTNSSPWPSPWPSSSSPSPSVLIPSSPSPSPSPSPTSSKRFFPFPLLLTPWAYEHLPNVPLLTQGEQGTCPLHRSLSSLHGKHEMSWREEREAEAEAEAETEAVEDSIDKRRVSD